MKPRISWSKSCADKRTYQQKLLDPRWRTRREEAIAHGGDRCSDCWGTDKRLEVHHTFYARGGPWETEVDCLIPLCRECHQVRQKCEDTIRQALGHKLATMNHHFIVSFAAKMALAIDEPERLIMHCDDVYLEHYNAPPERFPQCKQTVMWEGIP